MEMEAWSSGVYFAFIHFVVEIIWFLAVNTPQLKSRTLVDFEAIK
jgi:hypothetical protein